MFSVGKILYGVYLTVMGMIGSLCVAIVWKCCHQKLELSYCQALFRKWTRCRVQDDLVDIQEQSFSDTEMEAYLDLEADQSAPIPVPSNRDPKMCNQAVLRAAYKDWTKNNKIIEELERDKRNGRLNLAEMEKLRSKKKQNTELGHNLKKFKDGMNEEEDGQMNMFPTAEEQRMQRQDSPHLTPLEQWQHEDMCLKILWASLHQFAVQTAHLHILEQDSAKSNDWSYYIEKQGEHLIFAQQLTTYVEKNLPDKVEWFMRRFFYKSPFSQGIDYRNRLDAFMQEEEAENRRQQKKRQKIEVGIAQKILQRTRATTGTVSAVADIQEEEPMDEDVQEERMEVGGEENATSTKATQGKGGKRKATSGIPLRKQALEVTTRLSTPSAKKQRKCCQTEGKKQSKESAKKGTK